MKFNTRNFVSILTAFSFLAISVTGILYFVGAKNYYAEAIHVFFGFLFIIMSIFHIIYNFKALKSYIVNKKKAMANIKFFELLTALSVCLALFLFIFSCQNLTDNIIHSGKKLFGTEKSHDHTKHKESKEIHPLSK